MTTTEIALRNALTPELPGDTHVVMILDRSGSMNDRREDVIGGFNSFIETCREQGMERCDVQYARFDGEIEPSVFRLPLRDVPPMTAVLYAPRGSTALLDAVGGTVSPIVSNPDDRYVVIVFTDGYENASQEWTKEKVSALIKERDALGNWTFAFFGAEIDAWGEGGAMGFAQGNTHSHQRSGYDSMMRSNAKAAAIMTKRGIQRSSSLARTAAALSVDERLSDDEIERSLREEDVPNSEPTP
jgi:hypothetical protein